MSQSSRRESESPAGPKYPETRKREERKRREVVVITGKKYTRVPWLHRNGLSYPELSSFARQISRNGICQRGEFNRLENLWL